MSPIYQKCFVQNIEFPETSKFKGNKFKIVNSYFIQMKSQYLNIQSRNEAYLRDLFAPHCGGEFRQSPESKKKWIPRRHTLAGRRHTSARPQLKLHVGIKVHVGSSVASPMSLVGTELTRNETRLEVKQIHQFDLGDGRTNKCTIKIPLN